MDVVIGDADVFALYTLGFVGIKLHSRRGPVICSIQDTLSRARLLLNLVPQSGTVPATLTMSAFSVRIYRNDQRFPPFKAFRFHPFLTTSPRHPRHSLRHQVFPLDIITVALINSTNFVVPNGRTSLESSYSPFTRRQTPSPTPESSACQIHHWRPRRHHHQPPQKPLKTGFTAIGARE